MEWKVLYPTKNKMNLTSKEISLMLHLKTVRKIVTTQVPPVIDRES